MENDCSHPLLSSRAEWVEPEIVVADDGYSLRFTLNDAFMYHGYDAPGGVVLGWRLIQRAIAILSPDAEPERKDFTIFTSFPGLGFRDTVELVLRAVSGRRFVVDAEYDDPRAQEGVAGRFYYRFGYRGNTVELAPILGYPGDDFVRLGKASKRPNCTPEEAEQWRAAKFALAGVLLAAPAEAVIRTL